MENLDFGNIAIATVIVGFLNLVIVVLTKTETILTVVERIKGVIRVDYKSRAKRSDDEKRIIQKHSQVAWTRVRHTFVTMEKWDCQWTWNWSKDFEPVNIKGYCLGENMWFGASCDRPVYAYFIFPDKEESPYATFGISCIDRIATTHTRNRASFQIFESEINGRDAEEVLHEFVSKAILAERDSRIAKEIKKLRWQFWR